MKRLKIDCPACGSRMVYGEDAERQCYECGFAWTDQEYEGERDDDER